VNQHRNIDPLNLSLLYLHFNKIML